MELLHRIAIPLDGGGYISFAFALFWSCLSPVSTVNKVTVECSVEVA